MSSEPLFEVIVACSNYFIHWFSGTSGTLLIIFFLVFTELACFLPLAAIFSIVYIYYSVNNKDIK